MGRVGLRAGDAGYGVRMWAVMTTWLGVSGTVYMDHTLTGLNVSAMV